MVLNFLYKGIAGGIAGVPPVAISGSPCDHCDVLGTLRYQALTDARGRFTIRKVVPGQYQVRALARGYAAEYYHVVERYRPQNAFYLYSGQKRDNILIQLPRQAVLTGRVIDQNGQPVISAYVEAMQYEPFGAKRKTLQLLTATVTDDRGVYRIFGLSPGRYYLEARYEPGLDLSAFSPRDVAERFLRPSDNPDAFSPQFYYPGVTEPSKAKPIEVSAGQVKSGLDISVHPATSSQGSMLYPKRPQTARDGVITGKITNAHGEPSPCVRVVLFSPPYLSNRTWAHPIRETVTDDRGEYRFYQLAAGRYYVAAQIQPSNSVATRATATLPVTATATSGAAFASPYAYYPGAAIVANAKETRVTPGEQVNGIDFSVKPEATYSISGVVEGAALQAVNRGLRVILVPARSSYGLPLPVHESPPGASGKFHIDDVAPGSYILWATAFLRRHQLAAWAPITVEHTSITGVMLNPHPGWQVTGLLRVEGRPMQSSIYEVSAEQQDDPLAPEAALAGAVPPGSTFTLKGVFPGHYLVQVEAISTQLSRRLPGPGIRAVGRPSNLYIKSVSFGAQKKRTRRFEVPMQKPSGKLDLTVDWNGAQVKGMVMNSRGEPDNSAEIVLIPKNHRRLASWQVKLAQPYLNGRFLIPAVPPGRYRLFAWENVPVGSWLDPDFLDSQWKKGTVLNLSEGESKAVKLRVLTIPLPSSRRTR